MFLGQSLPGKGAPLGIVRAIYKSGDIFEGRMTMDGLFNGWGISYHSNGSISSGWWKDSYLHGNGINFDKNW